MDKTSVHMCSDHLLRCLNVNIKILVNVNGSR